MLLVFPFPSPTIVVWVFTIFVCADVSVYTIVASTSSEYCHILEY